MRFGKFCRKLLVRKSLGVFEFGSIHHFGAVLGQWRQGSIKFYYTLSR